MTRITRALIGLGAGILFLVPAGCFSYDVPRATGEEYDGRALPLWENDEQLEEWPERRERVGAEYRTSLAVAPLIDVRFGGIQADSPADGGSGETEEEPDDASADESPAEDAGGPASDGGAEGDGSPDGASGSGTTPEDGGTPEDSDDGAPAGPESDPDEEPDASPSGAEPAGTPIGPRDERVAHGPREPAPPMLAGYFEPVHQVVYFDMVEGVGYRCERCGAEVGADATECPECLMPFAPDEDGRLAETCPRCDEVVDEDAEVCPTCDLDLEEGPAEPVRFADRPTVGPGVGHGAGPRPDVEPTHHLCPRCGAHTRPADVRCPRCSLELRPPGAQAADAYLCPRCGNDVAPVDARCGVCDLRLQPGDDGTMAGKLVCPRCELPAAPGDEVCDRCGVHFLPGGARLSADFEPLGPDPHAHGEGDAANLVLSGPLCPRCGLVVEGDALACQRCGSVLSPPPYLVMRDLYCPRCGVPVAFDAEACTNCQVAIVPPHMRDEFHRPEAGMLEPLPPGLPTEEDLAARYADAAGALVCPRCETAVEEDTVFCPTCQFPVHPELMEDAADEGTRVVDLEEGEEGEEGEILGEGGEVPVDPYDFQEGVAAQLAQLGVFRTSEGEGRIGPDGDVVPLRGVTLTGSEEQRIDTLLDRAEADDLPFLLVPIVRRNAVGYAGTNGWWYPNMAIWLTIYLPSEWVPSENYLAETRIEYRLYSVRHRAPIWSTEAEGEEVVALNAWQRGWEIWGQVTVPLFQDAMLGQSNWDNIVPLAERTLSLSQVDFQRKFMRDASTFDQNVPLAVDRNNAPDARARSRSFALVIGAGDFPPETRDELLQPGFGGPSTQATFDANNLKQVLINEGWQAGATGQGNEVRFLQGPRATSDEIIRQVREWLYPRVFRDDQVLIWFSGYGSNGVGDQPDDDGFEKYLLTHDTEPGDVAETALGLHELHAELARLRSERVSVVLDTSFFDPNRRVRDLQATSEEDVSEGGAVNIFHRTFQNAPDRPVPGSAVDNYLGSYQEPGRGIVCAAGPNQVALEIRREGGEGGSAFATYFVEALTELDARERADGILGEDEPADGEVSLLEAVRYAQPEVTRYAIRRGGLRQQVVEGYIPEDFQLTGLEPAGEEPEDASDEEDPVAMR